MPRTGRPRLVRTPEQQLKVLQERRQFARERVVWRRKNQSACAASSFPRPLLPCPAQLSAVRLPSSPPLPLASASDCQPPSPVCITIDDDADDTDLQVEQLLNTALEPADLQCLQPREYLNDAIVDFWIRHLFTHAEPAVHCFTSFFWLRLCEPADRWTLWTTDVDFSATTIVMIPVCQDMHWTLIVVRLAGTVMVMWLDSLGGRISAKDIGALTKLLHLIADRRSDTDSDYAFVSPRVPRQRNLTDCGLYMLQFIEAVVQHPRAVEDYKDRTGKRALFSSAVNRSIAGGVRHKRREIMDVVEAE